MVYRSSFVVSIPENFIKKTFIEISDYTTFYEDYKKKNKELIKLKSSNFSSEVVFYENKELKELINNYVLSSNKILAKIIVDHQSPFLKSIIINKGSKDNIKIGTNVYDKSYLVGRVIEVNYKSSRVLLLSDLNSNVPVTITPKNIQAIVTGKGNSYGQIKYIKAGFSEKFTDQSKVYTSGTGAVFKSGIPIGKLIKIEDETNTKFDVEFYSDFSQLKYVFAEVDLKKNDINSDDDLTIGKNENPTQLKIKILEDELKIIEKSNFKLKEKNGNLKNEIYILNNKILNQQKEISSQKEAVNQTNIDKSELEFLRLNLIYGHKCKKSFMNSKGFKVGTQGYKKCVLNKGRKINE